MPIFRPTPGQRFILKLAFGQNLSSQEMIEFTDPRNEVQYRFSEVQFLRFLLEENRFRGPSTNDAAPRGLLASLGRRSGKSNLAITTALRCSERNLSCSIVGSDRYSSQEIADIIRYMPQGYQQNIQLYRRGDPSRRTTNLVVDEMAHQPPEVDELFDRLLWGSGRVFAFSSQNSGSMFDHVVLNPPPGVISVMMHTWEVLGEAAHLSRDTSDHVGSFGITTLARGTDSADANPATVPPVVEPRQRLSEEERFEQVMAGLGVVGL